ncbi:TnsA endonuclease N-terminal domain-containing protein [Nitrospirillum sp. BR 11164]|uniref:TnsA endonuclease N-terminal domain-containing protein n=1 Tax=Nitrospirillum sp. BR 11164 TaxID=3104324 RepID=UPI002AFE8FEF|nr:TnsA endonuclease N-terminal domain-containing protein [Nitrospirillum sp. BR 11164]MEA1647817.1 TnsA endonuclease N-terminal domain-containing protein [Nitrospirillum sp. BR 11164]
MTKERAIARHLHARRQGRVGPAILPATTTTFLEPDTDHTSDSGIWSPPAATTASRQPPARSRASFRGELFYDRANRTMVFESRLEMDLACILMTDHRVVGIEDQPPEVEYVDPNGLRRGHTFDFRVTLFDGARIAIAVKPSSKIERSRIREILSLIRLQVPDFADRFTVLAEDKITKSRADAARTIIWARRQRSQADIDVVAKVVSTLRGRLPIADLVRMAGIGPRGYVATACLIDEGCLRLAGRGPIQPEAMVEPTQPPLRRH